MLRMKLMVVILAAVLAVQFIPGTVCAGDDGGFVSETGNFLTGTVIKKSGLERSGVITLRTTWSYPSIAPVYRYDFEMLHGITDGRKYSYLLGDLAEIVFLPPTDGPQRLEVKLRNGAVVPLELTSDRSTVFGNVDLYIENVVVESEDFGRNIVPVTDIARLVFESPAESRQHSMSDLVEDLGNAIDLGLREDLIDEDLSVVLRKIHERMKARLDDGE